MNQSGRRSIALPAWLDAATVAILGTVLTVAVGIGAMVQTSFVGFRAEIRAELKETRQQLSANIGKVRDDLSTEIGQLDDRLRAVEIDVAAIRANVVGLDARVRAIELRRRRHRRQKRYRIPRYLSARPHDVGMPENSRRSARQALGQSRHAPNTPLESPSSATATVVLPSCEKP